jgi:hypothetical protein
MRAVLRLGVAIAAAALALGQAPALAQSAPAETSNTPAADAIGPRELQNFSLPGTVTRPPAETPAPTVAPPAPRSPAPSRPAETASSRPTAAPEGRPPASAPAPERLARAASPAPAPTAEPQAQSPSVSSITVDLPPAASAGARQSTAAAVPASAPAFSDVDAGDAGLAADHRFAFWPWLLAAMALGAGAAFLFWRRNGREAYAAGPRFDTFVAPGPEPRARAPRPAPPERPAPEPDPPQPVGIVSTRLRPWLDISFQPIRCVVEDERITFEFELALFNSGSAIARDVLVEAGMFNASPTQDTEIAAFFAQPAGQGDRIPELPPLKRVTLRPQLVVAREHVRVLDAGGRRLFVPLIAFNGHYGWAAGQGQTCAAYLVGRDTKGDKLAPFRLDLGPRIFRGLAARALPLMVRR